MFGEVTWLNQCGANGKVAPLDVLCFVFRTLILITSPVSAGMHFSSVNEKTSKESKKNKSIPRSESASQSSNSFTVIPIDQIEVNSSDVVSTSDHHVWVLIHANTPTTTAITDKVYQFSNRRKEVKQQFLRAIRKAVEQNHRQQASNNRQSTPIAVDGRGLSASRKCEQKVATVKLDLIDPPPTSKIVQPAVNGDAVTRDPGANRPVSHYSSQSTPK